MKDMGWKVRFKYLNISRQQATDFLRKQTGYQLIKKERPIVNKPIVGNYPNERWAIDLIDIKTYESFFDIVLPLIY